MARGEPDPQLPDNPPLRKLMESRETAAVVGGRLVIWSAGYEPLRAGVFLTCRSWPPRWKHPTGHIGHRLGVSACSRRKQAFARTVGAWWALRGSSVPLPFLYRP